MSAHPLWATSGCQSLTLVGESVNHHASTTAKRRVTAPTLRQRRRTNTSAIAAASAMSPATTLFAFPNGASNHTAPNAQVMAIMSMRRTNNPPAQRITRIRLPITRVTNDRGEQRRFQTGSIGLRVELENAMDLGDGLSI